MTAERFSPPAPDELEVSVFGPSKGECIVVHLPNDSWFVVDSFLVKGAAGREPVAVAYLKNALGVSSVDGVFLTHWHDDHTAGAAALLQTFAPSLRIVGVPSGYGKRELASFAADRLPFDLGSKLIRDLVAVFDVLATPELAAVRVVQLADGVQLEPPGNNLWTLTALSPSFEDERHHFETLLSFLPGSTKPPPATYDVNSGCAVLRLETNDTVVMLCSDLDVGDSVRRGWRCIVQNHAARLKSDLVKVGHHGSVTAFLKDAWAAFGANAKPKAVITPFPAANGRLPRPEMVERLAKVASPLHVTARARGSGAGKLNASDNPFPSYVVTSPSALRDTGQVRYRRKAGESAVRVDVFPPAQLLQ